MQMISATDVGGIRDPIIPAPCIVQFDALGDKVQLMYPVFDELFCDAG